MSHLLTDQTARSLRLHSIQVRMSGQETDSPFLSVDLPDRSPIVVVGPNGSGKSLAARALLSLFGEEEQGRQIAEELRADGFSTASATVTDGGQRLHVVYDLLSLTRESVVEAVDELSQRQGSGGNGHTLDQANRLMARARSSELTPLFGSLNLVVAGDVRLHADPALTGQMVRILLRPLQLERDGWRARLVELSGEDAGGGRIGDLKAELATAISDCRNQRQWAEELSNAETQSDQHHAELSRLVSLAEIARAESAVWNEISELARRGARLEVWLNEIAAEFRQVSDLRVRHEELQGRVDVLEARFRGVTDDFEELASEVAMLNGRKAELQEEISRRRQIVEAARSAVEEARARLASLPLPDVTDLETKRKEIAADLEICEKQHAEHSRRRIELLRKKEGLRLVGERRYSVFFALTPGQRMEVAMRAETTGSENSTVPEKQESGTGIPDALDVAAIAGLSRKEQAARLKAELIRRFAGFDRLPADTERLLTELFQHRSAVTGLQADLHELHHRYGVLKRKGRSNHGAIITGATAISAYAAGAIAAGWDIGLLAAVAGSGAAYLATYRWKRAAGADLESAGAAESFTLQCLKESREGATALEAKLGALAFERSLDEALSRWREYQKMLERLNGLAAEQAESKPNAEGGNETAQPKIETEDLPAALRSLNSDQLAKRWADFLSFESQWEALESEWSAYAEGGSLHGQLAALQNRMAELRQQQSELTAAIVQRTAPYEAERVQLLIEIEKNEKLAAQVDEWTRLEADLEATELEAQRLLKGMGGAAGSDLEEARSAWRELGKLRSTLRMVRNELSAHPVLDELRGRETLLADELDEVKKKLQSWDPLYLLQGNVAEYAERYAQQKQDADRALAELESQIEETRKRIIELDVEGKRARLSALPSAEELLGHVSEIRERLTSAERSAETTYEMLSQIERELQEIESSFEMRWMATIEESLLQLTDGKLRAACIKEGQWQVETSAGSWRRLSALSDGYQDLVAIAIRLAALALLANADRTPIVWDEPFARLDREWYEAIIERMQVLAATRQVILMTRDADLASWGEVVRLEADPLAVRPGGDGAD